MRLGLLAELKASGWVPDSPVNLGQDLAAGKTALTFFQNRPEPGMVQGKRTHVVERQVPCPGPRKCPGSTSKRISTRLRFAGQVQLRHVDCIISGLGLTSLSPSLQPKWLLGIRQARFDVGVRTGKGGISNVLHSRSSIGVWPAHDLLA